MPKPTRTPERISLPGGYYLQKTSRSSYAFYSGGKSIIGRIRVESAQAFATAMNGKPKGFWIETEYPNGGKQSVFQSQTATLQSPAGEWRSMEFAPKDTPVIVITQSGQVFKAHKTWCGEDCGWQWGTVEESDVCPNDWTDGACWASNADEERSDWPVGWLPLPPAPTGEV